MWGDWGQLEWSKGWLWSKYIAYKYEILHEKNYIKKEFQGLTTLSLISFPHPLSISIQYSRRILTFWEY